VKTGTEEILYHLGQAAEMQSGPVKFLQTNVAKFVQTNFGDFTLQNKLHKTL